MKKITKTESGKTLHFSKGDRITIELQENPTTGYLWKVIFYDQKQLKLIDENFTHITDGIGAGGKKNIEFEIIEKGNSKIEISNTNPWNHDISEKFWVNIES